LKAAAIFLMKLRLSRTLIAMERRWRAVIVLEGIGLLVEIVAGAADGRAAAGVIVDAAGAVVDGLVAAGVIVDAAGLVGDDTRFSCHGFSRIQTDRKRAATRVVAFLLCQTPVAPLCKCKEELSHLGLPVEWLLVESQGVAPR
jgi:hypothetical protein